MDKITLLARASIRKLVTYQSARSLCSGKNSQNKIYLDANESPESPAGEASSGFNRYPEPQPGVLTSRLAEIYGVSVDQLIVGRGADEAIDLLVRVFCEPGKDSILICPPTYGMYEISAQIQDAGIVKVPLLSPDFCLNRQGIGQALERDRSIKVIFICSPNNPTGNAFDLKTLSSLCEMTDDRAIVVVDEAYAEFNRSENNRITSMVHSLGRFPNLVILRTLSKAWAMAGARCGVAIAQPSVIQLLQKIRAPYPMSAPALEAVLKGINVASECALQERVKSTHEQRETLVQELSRLNDVEDIYPSAANFILVKFKDPRKIMEMTRAHGIILRDRSSDFSLTGCIRITIGNSNENQRLISLLKSISNSKPPTEYLGEP